MPTVGVITALREELAPLKAGGRLVKRAGGQRFHRIRLGETPLILTAGGVGPRRAAAAIRNLLEAFEMEAVLGLGIAGALTPDLAAEDLLAADEVRTPDGHSARCDPGLLACARNCGFPVRTGTLMTTPGLVPDGERKHSLGLQPGVAAPAAVDQESTAWVQGAQSAGIPVLVVRCIFDTMNEDLPPFLSAAGRPGEDFDRARLLRHVLTRPSTWPALLATQRRMRHCALRMASFTHAFAARVCTG